MKNWIQKLFLRRFQSKPKTPMQVLPPSVSDDVDFVTRQVKLIEVMTDICNIRHLELEEWDVWHMFHIWRECGHVLEPAKQLFDRTAKCEFKDSTDLMIKIVGYMWESGYINNAERNELKLIYWNRYNP